MSQPPQPSDDRGGPFLGIDIGGTKLAVALATADGRVLAEDRQPSHADEGPDRMIARAALMARGVADRAGVRLDGVEAVGIACGGPLDPWRGVVHNALNNPGWIDVPIVARIEAELGRRAFLDNDANAAALGEHRFGAGRGTREMIYLTISTGIGGGLILDDRLYHGTNGNAGELGHISVRVAGGRRCHCGAVGCLEAYCSGTNIVARYRETVASADGAPSTPNAARLSAREVAEAARGGDAVASAVWDETMELLGGGIVSIIHAFNPQLVVLGGGVTRAGDQLFAPVRRIVEERAMPWLAEPVRIVPAMLGERTGTLGAVAVAVDRIGLAAGAVA